MHAPTCPIDIGTQTKSKRVQTSHVNVLYFDYDSYIPLRMSVSDHQDGCLNWDNLNTNYFPAKMSKVCQKKYLFAYLHQWFLPGCSQNQKLPICASGTLVPGSPYWHRSRNVITDKTEHRTSTLTAQRRLCLKETLQSVLAMRSLVGRRKVSSC